MSIVLAILLGLSAGRVSAEDERSFLGDNRLLPAPGKKAVFKHSGPEYMIDLVGDEKKERIHFVSRDGRDWLVVRDAKGERVYQYAFRAVGLDATPYKIRLRSLSSSVKALVIYYYEGHSDYLKFQATARPYFLTFENDDLKTLSMYRGSGVFQEREAGGERYRQRTYRLKFVDWDGDGTRDIEVGSGDFRIRDIFLYRGKGRWRHLTKKP